MRVLIVTTSFPVRPGMPSGAFIKRLVEHLPENVNAKVLTPCIDRAVRYRDTSGFEVECFRYAPRSWQRLAHVPGGIPVALRCRPLLYLLLPWFLVCMVAACWRAARQVDLIHANWSINGMVAGLVARFRRLPAIITLRGDDVIRALHSPVYRWFLKRSLHWNARIVTVSEALRKRVLELCPEAENKLVVIPNGVEPALLQRTINLGEAGRLRLVTVGSLIPRKSVATLIGALARLETLEGIRLTVVGDGPEREALERLTTDLGLNGTVSFEGTVAPETVSHYLEGADALVLCSISEGRPNVVLEAMAAGVPVVATAIDAITEIISNGISGLLFEPGDEVGLAQRLDRLRAEPMLRQHLAEQARAFISGRNLFWDATGERYAVVYRTCIGG